MPLQIRRGTEAERQLLNVPPVEGELIWITDDFKLYIGDGTTLAKNLAPVTGYADANAVNAVGNAFATGTHNNINFTYAAGSISASVDLTDYQGEINATAIRSSIFADDSTELVNAVDSLINLNGTVGGHIIPDDTLEFDIGSPAFRFRDLYLSGTSIDLGGAIISSPDGSIVNLPAGSTIGGQSITSPVGDLKGSVFGDDSTQLVNGIDNTLSTGNLILDDASIDLVIDPDLNIGNRTGSTFERLNIFTNAAGSTMNIYGSSNGILAPGNTTYVSRGVWNNPTAVQPGDNLNVYTTYGYDGSNYQAASLIVQIADPFQSVSAGDVPGTIVLRNFTNGDTTSGKGLIIDSRGYTSINQGNNQPRETLDVGGNAIIDGTITGDLIGSVFTDGSTMVIDGTNGNIMYSPAVSGDWVGTAPTTIQEAIDRIAAALGPIA